MPVYIGSAEPGKYYLGGNELDRLYLGSTLIWNSFTPQDSTFTTPGTYTFIIPNGANYHISGRGGDGGGSGGGGGGGAHEQGTGTLTGGSAGAGGIGSINGASGTAGSVSGNRAHGAGGGSGAIGFKGGDSIVRNGATQIFIARGGAPGLTSGAGGRGSGLAAGGAARTTTGYTGSGIIGSTPIGGAKGFRDVANRFTDPPARSGGNGTRGHAGEALTESSFTNNTGSDITLTIIVGERGNGGGGGKGGRNGNVSNPTAGRQAGPGQDGADGDRGIANGWIRIRTAAGTAPTQSRPTFTDSTGDAQSWTIGTAVNLTVPAAAGIPIPTYAAVGTLPAGITFSPSTRLLSGNPTTAGTGTITIRATNSVGSTDWTVDYTIKAATPAGADHVFNLTAAVVFGQAGWLGWVQARGWGSATNRTFNTPDNVSREINGLFSQGGTTVRISLSAGTPEGQFPDQIVFERAGQTMTFGNSRGFANRGLGAQLDYVRTSGAININAILASGTTTQVTLKWD